VFYLNLPVRDPLPLQLLGHVLGGPGFGPYSRNGRNFFSHHLYGRDLQAASALFDRYLPSSYRREQYERWRSRHVLHIPVPDTGHVTFPGLDE
jgi:hypothetical protein